MREHEMTNEEFNKLLPPELKDFHDQKDFFKALHTHYANSQNKVPGNWVDNHIFTLDFFLWFMALHGYRLQRFKSRHFKQYDLIDTVNHYNEKRLKVIAEILQKPEPPTK